MIPDDERDPWEEMWTNEYEAWEAEQTDLFNEEFENARDE